MFTRAAQGNRANRSSERREISLLPMADKQAQRQLRDSTSGQNCGTSDGRGAGDEWNAPHSGPEGACPLVRTCVQNHQYIGYVNVGSSSKKPRGGGSSSGKFGRLCSLAAVLGLSVIPEFQSGGFTPSSQRTKKSLRRRIPSEPVAPWPPFGTKSRAKSLPAAISALATCSVDDGSTLVSSSPTVRYRWPFRFFAAVTFELAS